MLLIIVLTVLLVMLTAGAVAWMKEGSFLGAIFGWNLLESAGHVLGALISAVASALSD